MKVDCFTGTSRRIKWVHVKHITIVHQTPILPLERVMLSRANVPRRLWKNSTGTGSHKKAANEVRQPCRTKFGKALSEECGLSDSYVVFNGILQSFVFQVRVINQENFLCHWWTKKSFSNLCRPHHSCTTSLWATLFAVPSLHVTLEISHLFLRKVTIDLSSSIWNPPSHHRVLTNGQTLHIRIRM